MGRLLLVVLAVTFVVGLSTPGYGQFDERFRFDILGPCGDTIVGEPGETVRVDFTAAIDTPRAGIDGWIFSVGGEGPGAIRFFQDPLCAAECSAELIGEPLLVEFSPCFLDPTIEPQGPGLMSAVLLGTGADNRAQLGAGQTTLLPFSVEVTASEERDGPAIYTVFFDNLEMNHSCLLPDGQRSGGQAFNSSVAFGVKLILPILDTCVITVAGEGPAPTGLFLRGDCSGNGTVQGSTTDAIVLLRYAFLAGVTPQCLAACDAEANGSIDITDALRILQFVFLDRKPPDPPFPECKASREPGDVTLTCENPVCP